MTDTVPLRLSLIAGDGQVAVDFAGWHAEALRNPNHRRALHRALDDLVALVDTHNARQRDGAPDA
jgi:hypothetical protein